MDGSGLSYNYSCLSSLSSILTSQLLPKLVCLSSSVFNNPDHGQFCKFEHDVHKQLLHVGDLIIEKVFLTIITNPKFIDGAIKEFRSDGYYVHSRQKATTIQLFGGRTIRVKTVYMLPYKKNKKRQAGARGKGIYPVLKMLGIAHQATPALQSEATLSALNAPFAEATENMQRRGVEISEKRVKTLSENVGTTALEKREAELEQFKNGTLPEGDTFAGQRVVVASDGGRIRTRKKKRGRKKKNQKHHGFSTEWIEPKLFTIYTIDENGKKQNKQTLSVCDGTTLGRDKFKQILKMTFHKTGVLRASSLTFIGDGAPWIWNIAKEMIDEMNIDSEKIQMVIDFYHAAQHLWDVIEALPNYTNKQKRRLFDKYRKRLKKGEIDSLMECLGQKAKGAKTVYKALDYFRGNEDKCRYDVFAEKNIPIGSGAIESAIRRVVNLRLKGAGMFWLDENAESFLHLRCQLKSGKWEQFLLSHIKPA